MPRWFGALTIFGSIQHYKMVKNVLKKSAPECPVECGGGGPIAIQDFTKIPLLSGLKFMIPLGYTQQAPRLLVNM